MFASLKIAEILATFSGDRALLSLDWVPNSEALLDTIFMLIRTIGETSSIVFCYQVICTVLCCKTPVLAAYISLAKIAWVHCTIDELL